jgi:predicted metal-dependent enzyme (double-stranded beta helix superfamily)
MAPIIDRFAVQCSTILKAEPGPAGRQKVCDLLKKMLVDKTFVEATIAESTSEHHLLYEDPELKFCIFAETRSGQKTGEPHDHGPSWAIYGQAVGVTEMTEWERLEPAAGDQPGKVRKQKRYTMTPGSAYVYNEGVLHSPSRTDSTRLIRFEGVNLLTLKRERPKFQIVE